MSATEEDTCLKHRLINIQRGSKTTIKAILFKGQVITNPQQVANNLADYYEDLITPKNMEQFDDCYLSAIENQLIAIGKLNPNKAADCGGLRAEHLKPAIDILAPSMADIFNSILHDQRVPSKPGQPPPLTLPQNRPQDLSPEERKGPSQTY